MPLTEMLEPQLLGFCLRILRTLLAMALCRLGIDQHGWELEVLLTSCSEHG
jgi:hypothetical protein